MHWKGPRKHCHPRPKVCVLPTTTQVLPAKVHPTQHTIVEKTCEYIVPEVFPSHTTNVTNHVYKHVPSFPHTQSFEQTVSHYQMPPVAGMSMMPGPNMMPSQTAGMGSNVMPYGANVMPQGMKPQGGQQGYKGK